MIYGVMLDCSRNGVMTVNAVKEYVRIISEMGYNTLMLYTEDTYEVDNEPYFGYRRGKYSKEEIKEMDTYCQRVGVELIPCIQTLAHLQGVFKWDAYQEIRDCDDILLIGEERTYEFLENMFSSISQCFSSRKIHIGMDEAYKVGLGKYLEKNGYKNRFNVINGHLHRVCDVAEKYGFEPMIWSDMFCKLALNTEDYEGDVQKDPEEIRKLAALPDNISLVYWNYTSKDYDNYVNMIDVNRAFGKKVYFAGGAWTWRGFAPDNAFSMEVATTAMKACIDCGIDGWFMTAWGDDGDECSKFAILPTLMYTIEVAKGNSDLEVIKSKFKKITGADFDAFLILDDLDISGAKYGGNPSKYFLYNDPFLGLNDYRASKKNNESYRKLAEKIKNTDGKGPYEWLFDVYEKLCQILAIKCDLGVRTREYYRAKDMDALEKIACEEYIQTIEQIKIFHKALQKGWMQEKKPHGFDVQDIRIGALLQRLESCRERLLEFARGEIAGIPELEEEILPGSCGQKWCRLVTANAVSFLV